MKKSKQEKNHEKAYLIGMDAAHACFNKTMKKCGGLHPVNVHGFVSGYLQAIANHAPNKAAYRLLLKYCSPNW